MSAQKVMLGLGFVCILILAGPGQGFNNGASGSPQATERPGDLERAALGKAGFLVGEWEGEGWRLTRAGQRQKFLIKEIYRYRGNHDLLDMEGISRVIFPDGTPSPQKEYALGLLYYDRATREYRMWHYSDEGDVFTVKLDVDVEGKAGSYTRQNAGGGSYRFSIKIGEDGVWVSKAEIPNPDKSWLQVMEFRMTRVK